MPIRRCIITILVFLSSSATFANEPIWKDLTRSTAQTNERLFSLDTQALVDNIDRSLPSSASAKNTGLPTGLELPLPKGGSVKLVATEYSIMEEGASAYGDFRSWKVRGFDDPAISGVVDLSSSGFHAMLQMTDGEMVLIEPVTAANRQQSDTHNYKSYRKSENNSDEATPFSCGVHSTENPINPVALKQSPVIAQRVAQDLKTYKLAMAATGEFTEFFGGTTAAMNAISSIVNRVNFIYERDLGISLRLIDNNQNIVFTNRNTDPYLVNADDDLLNINTSVLDRFVGQSAYDIGHVLTRYTGSTGGVAFLDSVCRTTEKGGGTTGSRNPSTSVFAIDFVAHELGHQLGATHTFNSTTGSCAGANREAGTAYEPGGGSSIMAYAGICDVNDIAENSLPVFHVGSITQIDDATRIPGDCAVNTGSANQDPDINSWTTNLTVNAGEEFTLTGVASDPDGDELTYTWDQIDAGSASDKFIDAGNNALFEMNLPSSSPSRVFPGRALTNRNLNFRFVVRDGKGGISSEIATVRVINGSPPVANLFPLSSASGGAVDQSLFFFLLSVTLLVLGRRLYIYVPRYRFIFVKNRERLNSYKTRNSYNKLGKNND